MHRQSNAFDSSCFKTTSTAVSCRAAIETRFATGRHRGRGEGRIAPVDEPIYWLFLASLSRGAGRFIGGIETGRGSGVDKLDRRGTWAGMHLAVRVRVGGGYSTDSLQPVTWCWWRMCRGGEVQLANTSRWCKYKLLGGLCFLL